MTDSIDNKSKEKHDNLKVDLDAMLDEAESSLLPMNEFQDDEDAIDRLLMNSDFDDDAPGQPNMEEGSALKEVDDFFGLGDDFGESKLIQDDEVEATVPTVADLIAPNEEQRVVVEESDVDEDAGTPEELDGFSDFSDFNEPEMVRLDSPRTAAVEVEESVQATENSSAHIDDADLADEVDDFSGLSDDFNEADMIQDDKVETSADLVEQSFDDEDAIDSLFPDAGFDSEEALENADEKADELLDDVDEADMIQDEVDDWADLVASSEESQAVVEESVNDLQDDENNIDSLFSDAGFDSEDALEQMVGKKDDFSDDADLIEIDDFSQLDEVSDDFSGQAEGGQLAEAEKLSTQDDQEDDFLLPDFDITADTDISDLGGETEIKEDELADPFGETDFLSEDDVMQAFDPETVAQESGGDEALTESKPKPASVADTAIEDIENVKLIEQKAIKKQLEDAENKVKKAKLFSYVALGFGVVALFTAAGLGVMIFSAKTEVSKLTEAVSTLEASLAKSAANSPSEEIDAMRNSVVQLNQQVDGFITELKGHPQFPVDLLNNKVPDIVAKQGMVSKALDMLQVKMGGLEEKTPSALFVAEPPKVEAAHEPEPGPSKAEAVHESASNAHEMASVKIGAPQEHESPRVEATHELASVKAGAAHAPTKEGVAAHEVAPTKERAMHETAPAKVEAAHEITPAKVEAAHEVTPAKVKTQPKVVAVKPIVPAKAVPKQEPVKVKIQVAPGKWGVNLVAFKQEWFAKSKAAEFAQQGVFAEVIPVHERNTTMYRLRVGGFKSKAEANSNTARIKKALNLDSVWVSDN